MSAFSKTIQMQSRIILPLAQVKRRAVIDALALCGGNRLLAARLLGIGRTTIYRIVRAHKSQPPKEQRAGVVAVCQPSPQGSAPTVAT
jgi:DNA-binding NtrC family response regulator